MDNKQTKRFTLLHTRKLFERLDVLPFVILQSVCVVLYSSEDMNHLVKILVFFGLLLIQGIVFFSKFWSESLNSTICFKRVGDITAATHVRVDVVSDKFKMTNRTSICPIVLQPELDIISIDFEKITLTYDKDTKTFNKTRLHLGDKLIKDFAKSTPLDNGDEMKMLRSKFGENTMKIPIPSFFSLYKEHIVAPFFVFQLFCILLWVFDDYGLHSMITLIMLCIFEATVVSQRIFNLATLRKMRVSPHYLFVYRGSTWVKISSSELLPGDIVSVADGSTYDPVPEVEGEDKNSFILSLLKKLKEIKKKAEEQRNQKSVNTVINQLKDRDHCPLTCDMLLLSGSAIVNEAMLTGESVPQMKDSINKMEHEHNNHFDPKMKHKNCILYAGTKVVKAGSSGDEMEPLPENVKTPPPDRGAVCLVLKTGFSTSQGKLLRTVMFSSDRVKGDSRDAFIFIFILLAIAIMASYHVFVEGVKREGEVTNKLILRCIIILTSVVPAELPIELSLAINNSLLFLQGKRIVCIEPFRIPFAGKIDICCFDKTGTLTKDEFIMKGIVQSLSNEPIRSGVCDEETLSVILGCNSLIQIQGKVFGDPIELAVFKDAGGIFDKESITCSRKCRILPIRRYAFDSSLKRMSVLIRFFSGIYSNLNVTRVVTKGAPETIRNLLKEVPADYDMQYNKYAKLGYRILALAYADNNEFNFNTRREDAEKDLIFVGFVIVETPLKNKTKEYIAELIKAELDVCIITGDHHLTTAKVGQDLKLGPNESLFVKMEVDSIKWIDLEGKLKASTESVNEIKTLSQQYTLGLTGKEMDILENSSFINDKHNIFQHIKLFCRVSPGQKDDIIKHLIKSGRSPSMCGDGSNDVGALKRATIGIALLNVDESVHQKKQPFSILSLDDDTTIKSGDVTAAAPFTSKSGSIKCIKNIFIQGRCTLVVTFQMFKILALNCLLSAYSLSVLALKGVKFSDYQSTYIGFSVAIFFLMLSKAVPLKTLNKNKPPHSIFSPSSVISIIGQAVTNLLSLYFVIELTEKYDPINLSVVKSFDDPFSPTLMNTVVFLFSFLNQTINFVVNYQGEPFMENLSKNKTLLKFIAAIVGGCFVAAFDLYPQLNEYLELLPLPDELSYKLKFTGVIVADFVICYLFENWKKLFNIYNK